MNACDTRTAERTIEDPMTVMWERYRCTRDLKVRNELVKRYIPMVQMMAQKVKATLPPSVEDSDLENAGMVAMIGAIDKYESSRGAKFETFCSRRIHGAMIDYLRKLDFLPRMLRLKLQKLERVSQRMSNNLGRPPTDGELAEDMGISAKNIGKLRRDQRISLISLDRCVDSDDCEGQGRLKVWEDKKTATPLQCMEKQELRELIQKTLNRSERLIVMLYYYDRLTMREIGEALNITEARVCQIHGKVMRTLKKRLALS